MLRKAFVLVAFVTSAIACSSSSDNGSAPSIDAKPDSGSDAGGGVCADSVDAGGTCQIPDMEGPIQGVVCGGKCIRNTDTCDVAAGACSIGYSACGSCTTCVSESLTACGPNCAACEAPMNVRCLLGECRGAACNTIANETASVSEEVVVGSPPHAVGGTAVPGTYFLTHMTSYFPATGNDNGLPTTHEAVQLKVYSPTSIGMEMARRQGAASADENYTFAVELSENMFQPQILCPSQFGMGPFPEGQFSFDGSNFLLFVTSQAPIKPGSTVVYVFAKQ